jgi:transposase
MDLSTTIALHVVGCDVGSKEIVIFDSLGSTTVRIANEPAALACWASVLPAGALVVCEATGGYETALLTALCAAGVEAHRADARKVKAFIRSLGTLAKTDAIDARALARYGHERHASLARWQPPQTARARLQAMVLTRRDLVADRTAYKNRLKAPGGSHVAQHLEAVIECIDAQVAALDEEANRLIENTKDLKAAAKVLRGIKGIGATTAAALIALLPELGTTDRRRIASLAGLAPHPRQSGGMDAYRRVRGGRPEVKRVLFMAALSACRAEGPLRDAYNRLIQNGKKRMVAVIAIMRKIVVIANARIKELNQKGLTQPDELS